MARTIGSELQDVESVVRTRLRSLRTTLGLTLNDLAARANLSPSTISRIETGHRTISLDVLIPLADALGIGLDTLLDIRGDDDLVIRPSVSRSGERTTWMLSRPTANTIALKVRYEPTDRLMEQRTNPGHDWFFVTEGRLRLRLGERDRRRRGRGGRILHYETALHCGYRPIRRTDHGLRSRRTPRPRPQQAHRLAMIGRVSTSRDTLLT